MTARTLRKYSYLFSDWLDCRIPGPPNVLLKKAATAVAQSCLTMLLPRPLNVLLKKLPPQSRSRV